MKFRAYPSYKQSGIVWLGSIPSHWSTGRLKFLAASPPSNVDKNISDGELPVKLCNYVDVYNNDFITNDMVFMAGSATPAEVEKFSLKKGDVLVTKDSESGKILRCLRWCWKICGVFCAAITWP